MNSEKKTKLCKEYISQIKCFFPVIRQNEKKYINYISTSVNDYCIDNPDAAIEDLYNNTIFLVLHRRQSTAICLKIQIILYPILKK